MALTEAELLLLQCRQNPRWAAQEITELRGQSTEWQQLYLDQYPPKRDKRGYRA